MQLLVTKQKTKAFCVFASLLLLAGMVSAQDQEEIKAKHTAYALCVDNIEKDPHKAYEYCTDFLQRYPNADQTYLETVGKFVTAYKKIAHYVSTVPLTNFTEKTTGWAVYSPGLLAKIPSEASPHNNYQIFIEREYGSPAEERLLAKAESLYKNPDTVQLELLKQWRSIADPYFVIPDREPKWWTQQVDTILSAELVSTAAVLYYYNVSQEFRNKPEKPPQKAFGFWSTSLQYAASIKKMDLYERSGKSFTNVYVANMTMTWAQVCGALCGHGFTRNKIVVMSLDGQILEMFLDDPVNRMSWVS